MAHGLLLAESLRVGADLSVPGLVLTRLSRQDVSASVSPSQPKVWTLIDFQIADDRADELAAALADALLATDGWYADFVVGNDHLIVFAGRVFRYRRGDQAGRAEAVDYGRRAGTPEGQLDWGE